MPWQNPTPSVNHTNTNLIAIRIEWLDPVPTDEFGVIPFTYDEPRVDRSNATARNQFRARAEAARDAERTRIQQLNAFRASILTFMNA